jgi:hypothetical protein
MKLMKKMRLLIFSLSCLIFPTALVYAQHNEAKFSVFRSEPLQELRFGPAEQQRQSPDGKSSHVMVSFDAFGQHFELQLESNDRLIANLPKAQKKRLAAVQLYRGSVVGVANSWVRLTQYSERLSGMIWDGAEMYVIDSSDEVADALTTGPQSNTPYPLIYRLADATFDGQCALDPTATPLNDYQGLVGHLRELLAATRQLNFAVVADTQFAQTNSDPRGAVVARMNVVDGIFSEQVGVHLNVSEIRVLTNNGSLTATSPVTLLGQLGAFASGPGFVNPGLTHLFTGRNLDGSVIGVAFLSSLCSARFGVGLSEIRGTGTAGALTVAHEVGHNFGAPHDNQGGSPCARTTGTFIMNPFLNGSDQFSQCSLAQIQPNVTNATCLNSISPPPPPPNGTLFESYFNSGVDGFLYVDDAFGTNQPLYARGEFLVSGGFSGGGVRVVLGGRDDADILNMSGGWRRSFTLTASSNVVVSFRYQLIQTANYEDDEFSLALFSVDGRTIGANGNSFLARLTGNGNGGAAQTTGWVSVQLDLGVLATGTHTLVIGGSNNKKTFHDESTELRIDDVVAQTR